MKIKNRIKGLATLPHDRILPCPSNWRMHPETQRDALRGILADVGVVDTVLVRPTDGAALTSLRAIARGDRQAFDAWLAAYRGDFMLVDGHLRVEELQQHGPIDALVVDLDDREAAEVLAIFDPIGDLATMDREKFLSLAEDFNSTNPAVQALVADLAKVGTGPLPDFGLEGDSAVQGAKEMDIDDAFGRLPSGDKPPFQQMTFTLHDSQVDTVKAALEKAKAYDMDDGPNKNSNGNALYHICEAFGG